MFLLLEDLDLDSFINGRMRSLRLHYASGKFEMSSPVLPAALRRRRMGLADGLDIGSLLSYGLLITRRELRSSVG